MARPKGPPFTVPRYGSLGASIIGERNWLKKENKQLRAALRKYGYHDSECEWALTEGAPCICGLLGVIEGSREPQSEQRSTTEESK